MANDTEKDHLLEHSYDGIQEYDNPMPRWWVITFWVTIVFAVAYALNIGGIGLGAGRIAAYDAEMAAFRKAHPEIKAPDPAALLAAVANPDELKEGKAIFAKNCVACHGLDGGGIIGPNLTDDYWIHGGRIEQIGATVTTGVPAKGMPTWGKILKPKEVEEVVAYVWTLHGTTPAKPKAPEGLLVAR
jgi:cytochrome c oxidase cbb3-type subunit 3